MEKEARNGARDTREKKREMRVICRKTLRKTLSLLRLLGVEADSARAAPLPASRHACSVVLRPARPARVG